MSYLLDANVFMSAKNLHYGLDFCPAFWDWLAHKGNALAGNHVVVTHEVPANSPARIKIPNACVALSVRFMTPYQMLRTERARFVLGAHA